MKYYAFIPLEDAVMQQFKMAGHRLNFHHDFDSYQHHTDTLS